MKEKLMHYVWQHRLWLQRNMVTVDGDRVEVVDTGLLNPDAGPDFFNAKVKIAGQEWCGNIEMHVKASDWYRHGHQNDRAYDSVVLHVVEQSDMRIQRPDGMYIPQMLMPCRADFRVRYDAMVNNNSRPACCNELPHLPHLYITDWLTSLAYERLYSKVDRIQNLLKRFGGDWSEALYVTLSRALGFNTNSDAFERLALSTPLHYLLKHRDSYVTVEGTLFGQSGLLETAPDADHYIGQMRREYDFMCNKFGLTKPSCLGWRMARMRPANFPHRRIATLAALICHGFRVASEIFEVKDETSARRLFDIDLMGYWSRRYNFTADNAPSVKALSADSITILIINVIVPMLYAYGAAYDNHERQETAIALLQSLKAESNMIVRSFISAGVNCEDAFSSQAIIQLYRNYCEQRKCLYCRIGHRILATQVSENAMV